MPRDRRSSALALAVVALALACSVNTLANGFVFDDIQNIVQNRWITSVRYLPAVFASHAAGFDSGLATAYYRPMMHVLYLVIYQTFGMTPWAFHLVNLLLHGIVAALVVWVASELVHRFDASPDAASIPFLAGALFAVHPIHTEAVAWLAGITDLSYTAFLLAAFLLYLRAEAGFRPGAALGAGMFLLAALAKEPALVLPALLVLYEVSRSRDGAPLAYGAIAGRLVPFACAVVAYLALRLWALGGFAPNTRAYGLGAGAAVLNAMHLLVRYLAKLVWPFPFNALYAFTPVTPLAALGSVLGAAGLIASVWWAWRRPLVLLGAGFLVLPLLPVLYLPAAGEGAFAERYLYLPVFGAAMIAAVGIAACTRRNRVAGGAVLAVTGLVAASFAVVTVERNAVWRDGLSLWTDTVAKTPDSAVARDYLCWELYVRQRHAEAIRACTRALELEPARVSARVNLGYALAMSGQVDDAARQYAIVLEGRPRDPAALTGMGLVYMAKGWPYRAIDAYRRAIAAQPDYAEAHNDLGVALARMGRVEEAIPHLREAWRLQPSSAEYAANLSAATGLRRPAGAPQ